MRKNGCWGKEIIRGKTIFSFFIFPTPSFFPKTIFPGKFYDCRERDEKVWKMKKGENIWDI